jgi:hypothetical protein
VRTGTLAVAALLALAPASAAAADRPSHDGPRASAAIVGGQATNIANWPSIAFVVAFSGQDAAACTGTVIAPRWVVSAAHCAFDDGNQPVDALVTLTGVADVNGPGEAIAADSAVVDPRWDPVGLVGDVLLIHLARPSSRPAMPLAAPGGRYVSPVGVPNAAGWGTTDENSTIDTTVLRQAYLQLRSDECHPTDPATQFCAGSDETAGVCHGDSGGPLVMFRPHTGDPVLWGLTSFGPQVDFGLPPCDLSMPAVFSSVPAFAGFLGQAVPPPAGAPPPSPPPPPVIRPPRDTVAPVISRARLSRKRIRVARRGATIARRTGARLSFRLSEPAAVTITIVRRGPRRWKRLSPRVPLAVPAGSMSRRFSGRLDGRRLRRGRYRLRLDAVDAAGNAARPAKVPFRIVR